jgi:hypothetical protein
MVLSFRLYGREIAADAHLNDGAQGRRGKPFTELWRGHQSQDRLRFFSATISADCGGFRAGRAVVRVRIGQAANSAAPKGKGRDNNTPCPAAGSLTKNRCKSAGSGLKKSGTERSGKRLRPLLAKFCPLDAIGCPGRHDKGRSGKRHSRAILVATGR